MGTQHPFVDSYRQILKEEIPNLFRLYLNPYVVQTCYCLARYVHSIWPGAVEADGFQSFLANGFDEALSGAIKLARYCASMDGRPTTGLVIDPADRLGTFASATLEGGMLEFVPGLMVLRRTDDLKTIEQLAGRLGFIALIDIEADGLNDHIATLARRIERDGSLVIQCVNRRGLASLRRDRNHALRKLPADIVVFDESFVNHDVPFSAFTARKALFDHWNRPGKTTFHSTTYQPNTISTLHFLRCLETGDPEFHASIAGGLQRIHADPSLCGRLFQRLYSPSLFKAIRSAGFDTPDVRAAGSFVIVGGRRVFDGVSGVACSVRGHNPTSYAEEMDQLQNVPDCAAEVAARLRERTGLACVLPAVSGATAVENALKIGLVAQFPWRHVLALKAGFGGKTLLALTGTWKPTYKEHIDPLYTAVVYVDPFAPDATAQIDAALQQHPIAVVQVELIQAVGGVRAVPENVLRYLQARREQAGYLLLVDEVQTGLHRTGPFTRSGAMGLSPDLLVLGKGTSDMMFPFALLLYSLGVQARLEKQGSDLPAVIRKKYGYEFGYRTVLNVLRQAEELKLADRVAETGTLIAQLLGEGLAGCKAVREVRVHGLLVGIELSPAGWLRQRLRKRLYLLYILGMLRHPRFPVLMGYCQYEPNVLKFTPPLNVTPAEIREACATIVDVLNRPLYRLFPPVFAGWMRSIGIRRRNHEHGKHVNGAAHEPAPR